MNQRIFSIFLALCLCLSVIPAAHAQEDTPTPQEVYEILIAFKEKDGYMEGTAWDDNNHNNYTWKGGPLGGANIIATGCVAFAFELSDAAFGALPGRMYSNGAFQLTDVRPGDILRILGDTHTVIVLEVTEAGVVVAEGNYSGKVHWGRTLSKEEVEAANHFITRYPEGYIPPDDPSAGEVIDGGNFGGGLAWTLTKAGTLTISGSGAMPDYSAASETPWYASMDKIRTIVMENGVTNVGSSAFYGSAALSVTIPGSVTEIGSSAFRGSALISVSIPGSVRTVGDSAFRECGNLTSATIANGVEKIDGNAFRSCAALTSIALPASVKEVGAGAFFQCTKLTRAVFAPGAAAVTIGDNLFSGCYDLNEVTLPQKVDRIGEGMFQNCLMLTSLTIPEGAESIGGSAFASCSRLTRVWIPDSVTTIGAAAFSACGSLTDIYFSGSEAQWSAVGKQGDTVSALSGVTVHCGAQTPDTPNPAPDPTPDPTPDPPPTPAPGPSDGGSSSSGNTSYNPPSVTSTTVRNPDGSTTTTRTDNRTGTVTETTKYPDGSQTVVETQKDGTVTTRETDQDGNRTETAAHPDGSTTVVVERKDGTAATAVTDAGGRLEAQVSLSAAAVSAARQSGQSIPLPIPELQTAQGTGDASTVTVNTGSAEPVKVSLPAAAPTPGTVAVIVHADGTQEIVKTSVSMADCVEVSLPDGATVKLVDNRKDFVDVSSEYWGSDAIDFVSARELFAGTSPDTFTPEAPMTRAMLMTVLAHLDGVDLTGGATWYEKSVEWAVASGLSDGSAPERDCTREQLVMMLWRYAGSPAAGTLTGFTDEDQISDYARQAICWAVENGVISGFSNGTVEPQGQATRAQVAQILKNYIEKLS